MTAKTIAFISVLIYDLLITFGVFFLIAKYNFSAWWYLACVINGVTVFYRSAFNIKDEQ